MRYNDWLEEGKGDIVKRALKTTIAHGLKHPHHFYITFRTQFPGISLPDKLREHYPEEMTIVLNDAFWDLSVQEDSFSVDLLFENKKSTLKIPFKALVNFIDPSVEFALQFNWQLHLPSSSTTNIIYLDQFRQTS